MSCKNTIDLESIKENIRSGLVELIILQILSEEDVYGYKIKKLISESTDNVFTVKEGSLYGPLYRLCQRGYISSHLENAGGKRFRNYYHIEPLGQDYLNYGKSEFFNVFDACFKTFKLKNKSL